VSVCSCVYQLAKICSLLSRFERARLGGAVRIDPTGVIHYEAHLLRSAGHIADGRAHGRQSAALRRGAVRQSRSDYGWGADGR
jgi:hypothetical protein